MVQEPTFAILEPMKSINLRHPLEEGDPSYSRPLFKIAEWIPAFAGMTLW
jgi:hypothetical protein